ncbi:hypothetical protein LTR62_000397 [Meristemomyces frigidus]|uniref:Uncharacterized protein n=1 Tax=Meristemomyces frigidus TaxID=1508187 RepID=A0AAN7TGX4_9PEZI|nr:hypothetical protein LTR62_000397 [Meristemomyces frigidus]
MKTVSTLGATGAALSLGSIGLTLARRDEGRTPHDSDMLTVATTLTHTHTTSNTPPRFDFDPAGHRSFSAPKQTRFTRWTDQAGTPSSKRDRSVSSRISLGMGTEGVAQQDNGAPSPSLSQAGRPVSRPKSWLRRMSSSMSASRDSSLTPTSRPSSANVLHYSNGYLPLQRSGSSVQMLEQPPVPQAVSRNKLVKRTSSLRSTSDSASSSPGSRLPKPVLRRPLTSHQRSATMQNLQSQASREQYSPNSTGARDPAWKQFFTPKVARHTETSQYVGSTGIPNPIRRIYPDRKYTPVLVTGHELIRRSDVEMDDGFSEVNNEGVTARVSMPPSVASSPLPGHTSEVETSGIPRRSFSIGDLLATGPQPLWKRSGSTKSKITATKLPRKARTRIVSAPQPSMGSSLSSVTGSDAPRPAKRRDLTDPSAGHRSIYSLSDSTQTSDSRQQGTRLDLSPQASQSQHYAFPDSPIYGPPSTIAAPQLEQHTLPSTTSAAIEAHHTRISAAPSDLTASTTESESERRSTSGYSTDYQSDTVYDSLPTRTTRSSSGKRGPPIDTIFDDSPPSLSSGRSTKLRDFLSDGYFPGSEQSIRFRHSTIEEEGSVLSTPVRSIHDKSVTSTPSARPGAQQVYISSPPDGDLMHDLNDADWDALDVSQTMDHGLGIQQGFGTPMNGQQSYKIAPFRLSALGRSAAAASAQSTPNRYSNGGTDKATLFDWSEQQPSPSHNTQSPPRPRTVHGKKDNESRGSRAAGRRPPSGMHARSHSVPVVPDVDGKRSVVANKFGTWGVGSKAVTEDWNEDFEFEEPVPSLPEAAAAIMEEKRMDSGHEMFVPRSIREQQDNVVANISLLREWGLLIEELKSLRVRAVSLDMLTGPHAKAWQEVDAMIELADQESEESTLQPRRSPPSSPGFDYDAFDEPLPAVPEIAQLVVDSPRHSVISSTEDDGVPLASRLSPSNSVMSHRTAGRPRKDSEAVARSVIEALRSKRSVSNPTSLQPIATTKKVPFDTATLRHIVPYVNGLKRKVKDALRETEGLYSSPRRRPPPNYGGDDDDSANNDYGHNDVDVEMEDADADHEPSFRSIFNEPGPDSPTRQRSTRRAEAMTDNDGWEDWDEDPLRSDLAARLGRMSMPSS